MNLKHPCNLCLFGEDTAEEKAIPEESVASATETEEDFPENSSSEGENKENKCSEAAFLGADPEETSRTILIRAHLADLERQAQALKASFPKFDLNEEMKNPVFARMTAADVGIGVEDAYYAVHRKELHAAAMREAAEKTAEKLASAIRSGSRRPRESGASSQAPSVSTFDYAKACRSQREAFKKDLRARMARGEKVYPRG
jgi:hypothetical protein